ncbi:MAG TPA: glycine cleavage system protein GcvH [Dehalococcoidia bacterium]|nr:glycine cleavage system protein GcvH [Dehalococcoidia bacterium]
MDPRELRYAESHEWVFEKDGIATVGITDFAAARLGDIVFLELVSVGSKVKQFEKLGELESVKAVAVIFSPLSGEVVAVNEALKEEPDLVRKDPFGESWLVKLTADDVSELNNLMSFQEYQEFISRQEG